MTRIRRRFTVRGIVQGVGYRYFVLKTAVRLGVAGRVANLEDGRVGVEAEADEAVLEEFLACLRRGPSAADVAGVEAREMPVVNEPGFHVVSSWEMDRG